ncbi:MAG: RimK-like ATPgrasp N-terminal domain-containing protein [Peptococcaceae bacterium]|jgi:hypothetical protein|nr:RimK-like ATPgrasp N-terminal domain-containing protein [Peptococcaceae bacterium]MDH7525735.1 RimK-like ATPgrasp N-terminal domain-containing protein [Peptococcaceae bacterium]
MIWKKMGGEIILYRLNSDDTYLYNMFGDYTYLTEGYYKSLDCELSGINIRPTTEEALDAYVVPLAMKKAEFSGIKTPVHEIVTEKLTPPILAYPINPFTSKCEVIIEKENMGEDLKRVTMGGKYATICQRLPADYRIDVVRSLLGLTLQKEYTAFAMSVFKAFHLPLMRIRVIVTADEYLFSAIEPLPYDELTLKEKKMLEEMGTWQR